MGCRSSLTNEVKANQVERKEAINYLNPNFQDGLINIDSKFKDMPDSKSGLKIGFGLKRITNYICPLPYDKLDILREQFWMTRKKTDNIWPVLQECCEIDEEGARALLNQNKIVTLEDSLANTYWRKAPNYIYHIPNFCLNDPIFEKDFEKYEKIYDDMNDGLLKVNILYQNDKKNYVMKIRNKCTGFDFKHKFAKVVNVDIKTMNLRLFYKGQEIKNTHCLYYHDVSEDGVVLVLSVKKVGKVVERMLRRKGGKKTNENEDEEE